MNIEELELKIINQVSFFQRFLGLMFKEKVPRDIGYLFLNCRRVHTCFMRFPINVIGLDKEHNVISFKKNIKPWRYVLMEKEVTHVIECHIEIDIELRE